MGQLPTEVRQWHLVTSSFVRFGAAMLVRLVHLATLIRSTAGVRRRVKSSALTSIRSSTLTAEKSIASSVTISLEAQRRHGAVDAVQQAGPGMATC